jgi:3-phenylpropionate/trans-cinnamate dioxygenase ferredoxin reductase subunit
VTIKRVIIVGAGQAGGHAAVKLRDEGYEEEIVLIGNETHFPYERPALSKSVLLGQQKLTELLVIDEEKLTQLNCSFLRGTTVTSIDRLKKTVTINRLVKGSHGGKDEELAYSHLVLAMGGRVRTLGFPGVENDNILYLRTFEDSLAIKQRLENNKQLVVVGGGWIGLELASTAKKMGLDVVVLEFADRLCGRVMPAEMSDYLLHLHRSNGVEVRLNCAVSSVEQQQNGGLVVKLDGGESTGSLHTDFIVIGVGLIPNIELAEDAGLQIDNGVKVNQQGQTNDRAIYAIGDLANFESHALQKNLRLESWENANVMAKACARAICAKEPQSDQIPWFWSDQHATNIQVIGVPSAWPDPILRGEVSSGSFSWFYLNGGHIVATISVNAPSDMAVAKRICAKGITVHADEIVDVQRPLKSLLKKYP